MTNRERVRLAARVGVRAVTPRDDSD